MTPSLPTPAHSVTGNSGLDMGDEPDQHRDKRPRLDDPRNDEGDQIELEPVTQATNHDREDLLDTDNGRAGSAHTEHREIGGRSVDETTLEQLQKDMGEAFLLCRSSKALPALPSNVLVAGLLT